MRLGLFPIVGCILILLPLNAYAISFKCLSGGLSAFLRLKTPEPKAEAESAFGRGTSSLAELPINELRERLSEMMDLYGVPTSPFSEFTHPHFYNTWGAIFLNCANNEGGVEVGYADPTTHQVSRRLISSQEAQDYIRRRAKDSRELTLIIEGRHQYDPIATIQKFNTTVFTSPSGQAVHLENLIP